MDGKIICLMFLLGLYEGGMAQGTTTAAPTTTTAAPTTTTAAPTTTTADPTTTTADPTTTTALPTTTGGCKPLPWDDLTALYNSPVFNAEWMVTSVGNTPVLAGFIARSGVRVTLCDSSKWLIHQGPNGDIVVSSATYLSGMWMTQCSKNFYGQKTVSDFVNAAGKPFNFLFDCNIWDIVIWWPTTPVPTTTPPVPTTTTPVPTTTPPVPTTTTPVPTTTTPVPTTTTTAQLQLQLPQLQPQLCQQQQVAVNRYRGTILQRSITHLCSMLSGW
ncbi:hypothetical protein NQD34_002879 [Periophthalmus magnuspinnatus]|nr:hypothetical protein NQD34_002879 [Periophthalmus magnuspinnatus]